MFIIALCLARASTVDFMVYLIASPDLLMFNSQMEGERCQARKIFSMVIVKDFNQLLNRKVACSGLRVQVCPQCYYSLTVPGRASLARWFSRFCFHGLFFNVSF